ncbi:MAG: alpha-amylase family glycosyl hydrolase [Chitinophagaceae bacterium]
MLKKYTKSVCFILVLIFCLQVNQANAQTRVKKVIFQAFWWDYWNNNFRFKWADYITELAPRLKALGVDAVWIPPNYKNDGPGSVGYSPFDQYDLGDKYQKGETASDTVRTRSGTKDELLRMIAVLHANGIEVIQDAVLNHSSGAGNRGGAGGRDFTTTSQPWNDGSTNYFKNFRYVSYATPHLDTSAADYWTRSGRWSKNIQNFYPNPNNPAVNTNEINSVYFGPDMAYEQNSIGRSTNIPTSGSVTISGVTRDYFNPVQPNWYMFDNARDWLGWYKKQTGCDGWRWDAVKHFGFDLQRTASYYTKYGLGAGLNGGPTMLNIGEWVGTRGDVDYYASQMIHTGTPGTGAPTNEQLAGGFDFGLRAYGSTGNNGAIYPMVLGGGNFDMAQIPGMQQTEAFRYQDYPGGIRVHKTIPFVNSHDTYRPRYTTTGNYLANLGNSAGWDESQELGGNGKHIDPREPRFAAANAIIAAIDGNPCFYIEDVFDIFSQNKRWTHLPTNETDLPLRGDVANIMKAHQALNFKDGDYGVPTAQGGANAPFFSNGSSQDHIVFERTGKALIGVTDAYMFTNNNTTDQQVWVTVNNAWTPGTVLYDYSGAHGVTGRTIQPDRRFHVATAPNGHFITNAFGHGYSIWAPYPGGGTPATVQDLYNVLNNYTQPRATSTTQEWEMADDLGDSHCASLGQGGHLPANSTNQRVAGKIFVQNGTTVTINVLLENAASQCIVMLEDLNGMGSTAQLPSNGSAVFVVSGTGWRTIKIRQANNTTARQKAWIKATYTAPAVVNTRDEANSVRTKVAIWTGNKGTSNVSDCGNWEEGIFPTDSTTTIVSGLSNPQPIFNANATMTIQNLSLKEGAAPQIGNGVKLIVKGIVSSNGGNIVGAGTLSMGGTLAGQSIGGTANLSVSNLEVNNPNGFNISGIDVTVTGNLTFTNGLITINNNALNVNTYSGASTTSYIRTTNANSATGFVTKLLGSESFIFPVGNANYSPVTINNTSSSSNSTFSVRCFDNVLTNGLTGSTVSSTGRLNKTWDIRSSATSGLNVSATFNWNAADEGATFNRNSCRVAKNENGGLGWAPINNNTVAGGSNPYNLSAAGITSFSTFTVVSDNTILPVTWVSFSGRIVEQKVVLNWETANEVNNKGFYVQKSEDGTNFKQIGYVAASNNAAAVYSFNDDYTGKISYYRLLQEDKNGKTSFSKVVVINPSSIKQLVQIVPNPVVNNVELIANNIRLDEQLSVEVITAKGSRLAVYKGSFAVVKSSIQKVLVNQPAGLYTFVIKAGEKVQHYKVIKQ